MSDDIGSVLGESRCDRAQLITGYVAAFLASVSELALPFMIALSVSSVAAHGVGSAIVLVPVVGAVIGSGVTAAARAIVLTRIGAEEMSRLRLGVARRLMVMEPRGIEQLGVGEAVSAYAQTVNQVEPLLSADRIRRRTAVAVLVGCLCLLFWFDWRLASALFSALIVAAAAVVTVLRPIKERAGRALAALSRTAADLNEHLVSIRSATIWGLAAPRVRQLRRDLNGVADAERGIGRAQALVDLVVKITSMGLLIGLGAFGAVLVVDGTLSTARLSGFIATLAVLLGPAASYAHAGQQVQTARAAVDRLCAVSRTTRAPVSTLLSSSNEAPSSSTAVRAAEMTCAPPSGAVVGPVSFSAGLGELICLVGPSGSGKTTLLSALAALTPVCGGELSIRSDDRDIRTSSELWRQIAYVEQTTPTLGATVGEFLSPDPDNPPDADVVARLIEDLGMRERLGSDALDSPLERAGVSLSGGERQRLAIIRALASDRPLMLLDEPTAHLDDDAEERVLKAIDRARAGRIIIVASHSAAFVGRADRVVQL